ncbi:hypothetical protein [Mesorhizobium silamurunense]|nr:hypothetical protein [Mesorhizobium silamurunense]
MKDVMEKQNLSKAQARALVHRHGNDWRKIDEAAKFESDQLE